ncbi:MAG: hypothetical protein ABIK78_07100 [candidate division WOR-3 bacterium]
MALVKTLPYFSIEDLISFEKNKHYLKILFSRYEKSGKLIRLKKGMYVTKEYVDDLEKQGKISTFLEFLSEILYSPSYLSLEYVLYQHNLLTEIPKNFTAITKKKTTFFSNKFGNFFYHKIKDKLFYGFETIKEGDFIIFKARKAKALFDFLYLRKNEILNEDSFKELRLNLREISKKDKKELENFIKLDGSKKMKKILSFIF